MNAPANRSPRTIARRAIESVIVQHALKIPEFARWHDACCAWLIQDVRETPDLYLPAIRQLAGQYPQVVAWWSEMLETGQLPGDRRDPVADTFTACLMTISDPRQPDELKAHQTAFMAVMHSHPELWIKGYNA